MEVTLWMASAEEGFFFFLISRPLRLLMWDSSAHVLFYGVYKKDGMVGWGRSPKEEGVLFLIFVVVLFEGLCQEHVVFVVEDDVFQVFVS